MCKVFVKNSKFTVAQKMANSFRGGYFIFAASCSHTDCTFLMIMNCSPTSKLDENGLAQKIS